MRCRFFFYLFFGGLVFSILFRSLFRGLFSRFIGVLYLVFSSFSNFLCWLFIRLI